MSTNIQGRKSSGKSSENAARLGVDGLPFSDVGASSCKLAPEVSERALIESAFQRVQEARRQAGPQPYEVVRSVARNEPCPCGSGRKAKRCCEAPSSIVAGYEGLGGGRGRRGGDVLSVDDFRAAPAPETLAFADSARERGHVLRSFAEYVLESGGVSRAGAHAHAPCPYVNPVAHPERCAGDSTPPRARAGREEAHRACPNAVTSLTHPRLPGLGGEVVDCRSPDCAVCAERHHGEVLETGCPHAFFRPAIETVHEDQERGWIPCRSTGCEWCSEYELVQHERRDDFSSVTECPHPVTLTRTDRVTGDTVEWEKDCGRKGCDYCGPIRKRRVLAHYIEVFKRLPALRFITLTVDPKMRVSEDAESPDGDGETLTAEESSHYLKSIWKNRYLGRLKRRLKKKGHSLYYVGSVEHHESGYAHFHAIVSCPLAPDVMADQWFESGGGVVADVQTFGVDVDAETVAKKTGYALKYAFKEDDKTEAFGGELMNTKCIGYHSAHYVQQREKYAAAEAEGKAGSFEVVHAWEEGEAGEAGEKESPSSASSKNGDSGADSAPVDSSMIDPEAAAKYSLQEREKFEFRRDVEKLFAEDHLFPWEARKVWSAPDGAGKRGSDPWDCPQPVRGGPPWLPGVDYWTFETLRERWKRMEKGARSVTWVKDHGDGTGTRETYVRVKKERERESVIRFRRPGGAKAWRAEEYPGEAEEVREANG